MAKIGLKRPVYKSDTDSGVIGDSSRYFNSKPATPNFTPMTELPKAIQVFCPAQLRWVLMIYRMKHRRLFLGHDLSVDGEITASVDDVAPYVGVGFYGKKSQFGR